MRIFWALIFICFLATAPVISGCWQSHYQHGIGVIMDYDKSRHRLVYGEIAEKVKDRRVLEALNATERHLFVPQELRLQSYHNHPLEIGFGQTISQPLIVGMMSEALDPLPDQRILEIGTGSGYQAAVLSHLVHEVYSIEIIAQLAERTTLLLEDLGYNNIFVKVGDGSFGWQEHAPYDGIIVTAAPERVPDQLISQLKEGGRIVIPVGRDQQKLKVLQKRGQQLIEKDLGGVKFVPMTGSIFTR